MVWSIVFYNCTSSDSTVVTLENKQRTRKTRRSDPLLTRGFGFSFGKQGGSYVRN